LEPCAGCLIQKNARGCVEVTRVIEKLGQKKRKEAGKLRNELLPQKETFRVYMRKEWKIEGLGQEPKGVEEVDETNKKDP